jgi:hypothetical protein
MARERGEIAQTGKQLETIVQKKSPNAIRVGGFF